MFHRTNKAAATALLALALPPALGADAPPLLADQQAPSAIGKPGQARREQRLNLLLRVVRVPFAENGKPIAEPQVVQTSTKPIFRNLPGPGAISLVAGEAEKAEVSSWSFATSMGASALLASPHATRQFRSPFTFRVQANTRIQDDDSVVLWARLRKRGALPTWSRWRYVNQYAEQTTPERRLIPGQAFERIAEVRAWASDETRVQVLQGGLPPSSGEAYTAYYLEVSVERVPAALSTADWLGQTR